MFLLFWLNTPSRIWFHCEYMSVYLMVRELCVAYHLTLFWDVQICCSDTGFIIDCMFQFVFVELANKGVPPVKFFMLPTQWQSEE